jgi:hypothetical protein
MDYFWERLAIVEIKCGRSSLRSEFVQAIRKRYIKPITFSKYCVSQALLTPELKANRFKYRI